MALACTDASCKCWIRLRFGEFGGQIDSFGCLSRPPKRSLGVLLIHLFIYFAVESGVFPVEVAVIGRCDNHAENRTAAINYHCRGKKGAKPAAQTGPDIRLKQVAMLQVGFIMHTKTHTCTPAVHRHCSGQYSF